MIAPSSSKQRNITFQSKHVTHPPTHPADPRKTVENRLSFCKIMNERTFLLFLLLLDLLWNFVPNNPLARQKTSSTMNQKSWGAGNKK